MRAVGDYTKAGIPMLPVVVSEKKTAQYIALNTFLLVPLSSYRRLTGSRHDSCRSQTRRQSDQSSGLDSLQVLQSLSGDRVSCDGSGREASSTLFSNIDKSEFRGES